MKSPVKKWGNSLALRIPKGLAQEVGLQQNGAVELRVQEGSLLVTPLRHAYDLDVLLSSVTQENLRSETDWTERQGQEAW